MSGIKSEAVIIGQGRLRMFGDKQYTFFDPLPGCDPDALDPLEEGDINAGTDSMEL